MDDLSFITGSRAPQDPFFAEEERALCAADLLAKSAPGTAAIKRLRDSHHQIAAMLAAGVTATEVAATTGYSEIRISLLQSDPAFKGLLEFYRGRTRESLEKVIDRIKVLGLDALAELQERLDQSPEDFTNADLMRLVGLTMDRAGYGATKKIEVSQGLTREEIEALKQAAKQRERVVDAQTIDAEWSEASPESDGRSEVGGARVLAFSQPRLEGGGEGVREEAGEGAKTAV